MPYSSANWFTNKFKLFCCGYGSPLKVYWAAFFPPFFLNSNIAKAKKVCIKVTKLNNEFFHKEIAILETLLNSIPHAYEIWYLQITGFADVRYSIKCDSSHQSTMKKIKTPNAPMVGYFQTPLNQSFFFFISKQFININAYYFFSQLTLMLNVICLETKQKYERTTIWQIASDHSVSLLISTFSRSDISTSKI